MINEIKRRLNIGETVELECIDWNKFSRSLFQRTMGRKFTEIVIESVDDDNQTLILDSGVKLLFSELKYFKIKDQAPTFNDLIDVAVQAYKDGVITSQLTIMSTGIHFFGEERSAISFSNLSKGIEKGIEFIKSLYTETFVIESEKDIIKVISRKEIGFNKKSMTVAKLMNGNEILITRLDSDNVTDVVVYMRNGLYKNYLDIEVLKGATVTQRKDNESKY